MELVAFLFSNVQNFCFVIDSQRWNGKTALHMINFNNTCIYQNYFTSSHNSCRLKFKLQEQVSFNETSHGKIFTRKNKV